MQRGNGGLAEYRYDPAGRLDRLSQSGGAGEPFVQTTLYNPASQVVGVTQANDNYVYADRPKLTNLTYDGRNRDQTLATNGGYDPNQNLINDGQRVFTYDVENRLVHAGGGQGGTFDVGYDPLGRLSSTNASGTVTNFLYDNQRLVGEYGASGTPLRQCPWPQCR